MKLLQKTYILLLLIILVDCQKRIKSSKVVNQIPNPVFSFLGDYVVCPNGQNCPITQKCCPNQVGGYGCCPYHKGDCCPDKAHCCPEGYVCEPDSQWCVPSKARTICPNKSHFCPDGETCCQLFDDSWGCCTYENATCCGDKQHCCPRDYQCYKDGKSCIKQDNIIPASFKKQALPIAKNSTCSDGKFTCPVGATCCGSSRNGHHCCPFKSGICCEKGNHCCPKNYACSNDGKGCIPLSTNDQLVICPDGKSACQNRYTCCLMKSGAYGCCAYHNATCCNDGLHCCPENYECDKTGTLCRFRISDKPILTQQSQQPLTRTKCPAWDTYCPGKMTCCPIEDGYWSCCPAQNATCCPDMKSCCPYGMKCNANNTDCIPKNQTEFSLKSNVMKLTTKSIAQPNEITKSKLTMPPFPFVNQLLRLSQLECPDKISMCPTSHYTCCLRNEGTYGCCPIKESRKINKTAQCCKNGLHCCEKGRQCTEDGTGCM